MDKIFDYLKKIFNDHNFRLYMIGSTSRDYLLNREINDYDFVSDATPSDIAKFLKCDHTFARFGTVKYYYENKKIDIVTLRKESEYKDFRHPSKIEFVKDIDIDYKRRDFTINAIYIDENYNVIDPTKCGINDLNSRHLRFIKDPLTSIKEDPLRILRAYRFIKEYNLSIDEKDLRILKENEDLLKHLNVNKIKEEEKKLKGALKNYEK